MKEYNVSKWEVCRCAYMYVWGRSEYRIQESMFLACSKVFQLQVEFPVLLLLLLVLLLLVARTLEQVKLFLIILF